MKGPIDARPEESDDDRRADDPIGGRKAQKGKAIRRPGGVSAPFRAGGLVEGRRMEMGHTRCYIITLAMSKRAVTGLRARLDQLSRPGTRITRKSLTLVRVGPVTRRSPSFSKAV